MYKARVRTLQALVMGTSCLATHTKLQNIQSEFNEVYAVRKVRRGTRRRILEVLHSTRALDTALGAFVGYYGCRVPGCSAPRSLGQYLKALRHHSVAGLRQLTKTDQKRFQSGIVDLRNQYMHEAGAFPAADAEIQVLLAEMHTCLTVVFRL